MEYIEKLKEVSKRCGNCACMGLDPVKEFLPKRNDDELGIAEFFEDLFSAMKKANLAPAAFKPNIGYYTIYDKPYEGQFLGSLALVKTITLIKDYFGDVPIILDAKRGDIATSSLNYAKEAFDVWKSDAVTVSPYMGDDSIMPFVEGFKGKGVYLLNRTSNRGASTFQDLLTSSKDGDVVKLEPLYIRVAEQIIFYKQKRINMGAVLGATRPEELLIIAQAFKQGCSASLPLLIPGVGSQGGSAKDVCSSLKSIEYDLSVVRINSSSALTHPWKNKGAPTNYIEECVNNIANFLKECAI